MSLEEKFIKFSHHNFTVVYSPNADMAAMNSWLILCFVLVHFAYLGSCDSDYEIADGAQTELFIFHELCALKKDEGPCKVLKERFYFEIDTGRCESFEFGGCRGNGNNFETLEACEGMCLVSADKSPCHLDEAPGPCRGLVTRYFFDSQSQECKHFYYGGCFGNANNFKSMKECQARCQNPENANLAPKLDLTPKLEDTVPEPTSNPNVQPLKVTDFSPPEFCLSTIDKGTTCDREERRTGKRYVYNPKTKRCHWLRNRGCVGNKNSFVLKRHCMKMCMKPSKIQVTVFSNTGPIEILGVQAFVPAQH